MEMGSASIGFGGGQVVLADRVEMHNARGLRIDRRVFVGQKGWHLEM